LVTKEKLIDGSLTSILQLLCETQYGEHNILVYPNLDAFREIYTHLAKARVEDKNDRVVLLPHYETAKSVEQAFIELDVDARKLVEKGDLEIIDSHHGFFDPAQSFQRVVEASAIDAVRNGKSGAIIVADMGSFFHRQEVDRLISHECGISIHEAEQRFTIFCCYHQKDFEKLSKEQESKMCENHFHNLFVRDSQE
jgi:hypothetical protein